MQKSNYRKFAAMLATSFIIMYAVMYLNVDQIDHIYTAQTRTYMTILMIAPMAISMLLFMWDMYGNVKLNYIILAASLIIGSSTYYVLRQQTFVDDVAWMRAMIPHHSSAIMVSQKAQLKDAEAQQLAKDIIAAQQREIAQMKQMINRLENK